MGKGANKRLLENSGTAQTRSGQADTNATAIGAPLTSQLQSEATNPQGYTPQQMAYMNTASQQSLGGSTAGITGQGNLEATRTRNAGGATGAIDSASRSNARDLSQNALQVQTDQAKMQQAQKQQALESLRQLYGVDESTAEGYLNSSDTALNDEENASQNQNNAMWGNIFKGLSVLKPAPVPA